MAACGIGAVAIHGNKSQAQRTTALQAFRDGRARILVATDIAARGIDVSGVSHVFNFELPNVPEQYVHRIGRTARAGAEGVAISFCAPDEKPYLKDIEKLTRVKLDVVPLPDNFVAQVNAMPKPTRSDAPQQQARHDRSAGQGQGRPAKSGGGRSAPSQAPREDGDGPRRFRRRRGPVGAHRGAVSRVG
jgi:ATP-dependent RNA helicase RhlE